ncbi:MAG: hypothetical protein ACD_80C00118G0004 [uncultured bacterium (gcode 4)]|uniref:Uncharacterized protein n=1 Tax=uncultured bacterium (gcode 4) TaxID=1234023 RepID=K1X4P1_9BACT|nr:MAG: hypothetical protein ACD_80C00118G0004 [uncultured bacterium (gcode 4)]
MTYTSPPGEEIYQEKIHLHTNKQNLNNKKIYFDSDGTEIKIWYDEETGVGFVEIIWK